MALWSQQKSANRYYKRLTTGLTKRSNIDPVKYKDYLTKEQYDEILRILNKDPVKINKDLYTLNYIKDKLINNPNDNIKLSTKTKHKNTIGGIYNLFNADNLIQVIDTNKIELVEKIKNAYVSSTTQISVLLILLENLLPELTDPYKNLIEYLKDSRRDLTNIQSANDFENRKQDDTDYSAEYKKLLELKNKYKDYSNEHLIALLYTDGIYNSKKVLTMVARGYFKDVNIVEDEDDINDTDNFYILSTGRLILNDFKTSKIYKYNYILPINIQTIIKLSLNLRPRKWLIADKNGDKLKSTAYWKLCQNTLGIGNQQYRKIIENEFIKNKYDQIKLADAMGHSVNTQKRNYVSNN